ncbi:MAG: hypothetical protein AAFR74_07070 [Pseudomonadota bacterium]
MIRTSFSTALVAAGLALCVAPAANAQYYDSGNSYGYTGSQPIPHTSNCKKQRDENRVAGAVVGAIAGGLLGSAIGGEIDDDNDRDYNRRYRGYRGYRGNRGYRGHGRFRHNRDSDGAQIAGTLIGAAVGGFAGSEIAAGATECKTSGYPHGDIPPPRPRPYSSTGGYGYADTQTYPLTTTRTVRTIRVQDDPLYGGPVQTRQVVHAPQPAPVYQPAQQPVCETVQRETRLPDGGIIREPVSVCQQSDGRWEFTDSQTRY